MSRSRIAIIGSSNTDMVVQCHQFPVPGQSVMGEQFMITQGGKGANQAVAAARMGGKLSFISRVGNDAFGLQTKAVLKADGIGINSVLITENTPTGVAVITVDSSGENTIVVAPGANEKLSPDDIDQCWKEISNAEYILTQLEIPEITVRHVIRKGVEHGKKIIVNPAPARHLDDEILSGVYLLTPNQTEAEFLTGIKVVDQGTAKKASEILFNKGVEVVIITLGSEGAYIYSREFTELIKAPMVDALDTTAAGDTFNGALVAALSHGENLLKAVAFACKAASISVTRMGAQSSIPYLKELGSKPYW